jgi:putative polymerase
VSRYVTHEYSPRRLAPAKAASSRQYEWSCFAIIFSALSFNFFLCFANTNAIEISDFHVIAAEIAIISITFLVSVRAIGRQQFVLIGVMFLYLLFLILVRANVSSNSGIEVKVVRDFTIPVAFFLLGRRVGDLRNADTIVFVLAIVVTSVAVFEYFFLDVYLKYFNIIMYYVARGTLATARLAISSSNLFESGIRPEGRTLLPFLGDHRVSSIFLEPVSLGNFAMILFFWAMIRFKFEKRLCAALLLMAIFLIIMADSRFSAYLCVLALGAFLLPKRYISAAVAWLPIVCLSGLIGIAYIFQNLIIDDSFLGRAVSSGRNLTAFDIPTWLGAGESASFAYDSGYAYAISQIGILGFAVFWFVLMTVKGASREFLMFRSLTGLYLATILCISYSPFTIKTAALLWFLFGALAVVPGKSVHTLEASSIERHSPKSA